MRGKRWRVSWTSGSNPCSPTAQLVYAADLEDTWVRYSAGVKLSIDIGQNLGLTRWTNDNRIIDSQTVGLGCGRGSVKTPCPWCGPPISRKTFELKAVDFYASVITSEVIEVAFENVAVHSSATSAQLFGFGRGLLLANCQRHGIPVQSMYQQTWKSRCGAKGVSKEAYVARASEILGQSLTMVNEDQSASICIGYAAFVVKP